MSKQHKPALSISRKQFLRAAAAGAGLLATPFIFRAGARGAAPITLKLASIDTPQSPNQKIAERFAELVAQKSNGAIKIQTYAVGQLGTLQNIVTGLQTGVIDFSTMTAGFLESYYPHMQLVDLPFLFRDAGTAEKLLDGPVGQKMFADMPAKGMLGLAWGTYGWREVETIDRRVREPADLKGMKIRVQPGPVFSATFQAVGAIPVFLDITELYIGLSQRTVSGYELPLGATLASKLYEVSKFIGLTNHVYNAMPLIASKDRFEALDKNNQTVIRDAAAELLPWWRSLIVQTTADAKATLLKNGQTIDETNYEAFHKEMVPVYAKFRDSIGGELLDQAIKASS